MPGRIVALDNSKAISMPVALRELRKLDHELVIYRDAAEFQRMASPLRDADAVVATVGFKVTAQMLADAPRLRVVASTGIGVDIFDVDYANKTGLVVAHSRAPEHVIGMAEASILLILACIHDLPGDERIVRQDLPRTPKMTGYTLAGKTIGIIGLGEIGRAVARRLGGWDAKLQAYAPRLRNRAPVGVVMVGLEDLLRSSDVVTIHSSLNAETRHLLNAERLGWMKPGAILINTARGEIIDEAALHPLVESGAIGWIGLDVNEIEPLPRNSPLLKLKNAILTPHMLGATREAAESLGVMAYENVKYALEGKEPPCVFNPAVLPEWRRKWIGKPVG